MNSQFDRIYKVLIVDDEPSILSLFEHLFEDEKWIKIFTFSNPFHALKEVKSNSFDLVISDIQMPQMMGYQFLQEVKKLTPYSRTALITGYDVEQYIQIALKYGITNIITKDHTFNIDWVKTYIWNLLTRNIFGLKSYLQKHSARVFRLRINNSCYIESFIDAIHEELDKNEIKADLRLPVTEILTNAFRHPAQDAENNKKKDLKNNHITLDPHKQIFVEYGWDDTKVGISVSDPMGALNKEDILYHLKRNTTIGKDGLPENIYDTEGRGLFLVWYNVDRMIINVAPSEKTEVIVLNFFEKYRSKGRLHPLFINEI